MADFDPTQVKLGKNEPKNDPNTPQLNNYLNRGAAKRAIAYKLAKQALGGIAQYPTYSEPSRPGSHHSQITTTLSNINGTGVVGGVSTISAKLSIGPTPIISQKITFELQNRSSFHALTNAEGVATVTGIPAPRRAGVYTVFAGYLGKGEYRASQGMGQLVVTDRPVPKPPGPTVPGPTVPGPTVPGPTVPGPTVPGPTVPGPTVPGPTVPGPTVPGPTVPGPTVPGPTAPGPVPSATLPLPPPSDDHTTNITNLGIMDNDSVGDCTCASAGHMIQTWTACVGNQVIIPDSAVLAAYEAVSGYVPGKPETDVGATCEDVLSYWHKVGIGGHKIDAYAAFDVKNATDVEDVMYLFGGIYLGIDMPISAQNQTGHNLVWDVPITGLHGDGAPGSWGGHAAPIVEYDSTGLTCITWGDFQRMTWNFLRTYCVEAYAVLARDWLNANGVSPDDFDINALLQDIKLV